jgi:type IX secretion system substrate protein/PKD domain-containing protein/SprB-like repeat protein/CUB-like protein
MKKLYITLIIFISLGIINNTFSQNIDDFAGDLTNSCAGTLYDNGGSSNDYGDNRNDALRISIPTALFIRIIVDDVDLETDYRGDDDFLRIYDGSSDASTLMVTYTDEDTYNVNDTFYTSTNEAYISFITDDNRKEPGFVIQWQGMYQVTPTTVDIKCNGDNSGEINFDEDGSRPADYEWYGPDGYFSYIQEISGLYAGSYHYVATDTNSCTADTTFIIRDSSKVEYATNVSNVSCYGMDDGEIIIYNVSGGNENYLYSIDTGTTWQASNTFSNLTNDTYKVVVKDLNDCLSDSTEVIITQPIDINNQTLYGATPDTIKYCFGETVTLSSGSQIGIEYQLLKDNIDLGNPIDGTGNVIEWSGLSDAEYHVIATVSDAPACTKPMLDTIPVIENPLPDITISDATICDGNDHNIVITENSAFTPSNYLWSTGTGEGVATHIVTAAGKYTVTVVDDNNCEGSDFMFLTVDDAPEAFTVSGPSEYCSSEGGVTINLSSSEAATDYQLKVGGSDDGSPVTGDGNEINWTSKTDGTYTVVADNGCIVEMTGTVVVTENASPTAFDLSAPTDSYCAGESGVQLELSWSTSGVSYQLKQNGSSFNAPQEGVNNKLFWNNILTESYEVVATDNTSACTTTMNNTVVITELSIPSAYTISANDSSYCADVNGVTISLNNSQNSTDYYLQQSGTNIDTLAGSVGTQLDWNNMLAETYTIVADNGACTSDMSGSVDVIAHPVIIDYSLSTSANSFCDGDVGVTLTLASSQSGINYQLYDIATPIGSIIVGTGFPLNWNNVTEGDYTVVATNPSTLCSLTMDEGSGSISIARNSLPNTYIVSADDSSYCFDITGVTISLSSSITGTTYYLKDDGSTVSSLPGNTGVQLDWNDMPEGTYTITADDLTCTNDMDGSVEVIKHPEITDHLLSASKNYYCSLGDGDTLTLDGSQIDINYQLNENIAGDVGSPLPGTLSSLTWTNVTEGTYKVIATNPATGCSLDMGETEIITVSPLPTAYTVTSDTLNYCADINGVIIELENSDDNTVEYQYMMDGNPIGSPVDGISDSLTWDNNLAGDYTVIATIKATGCSSTSNTITIGQHPAITKYALVALDTAYCDGSSGVTLQLLGSQLNVDYQLKTPNVDTLVAQSGDNSALYWFNVIENSYYVEATDVNTNCMLDMSGNPEISIYPLPTAYNVTMPDALYGGNYCAESAGILVGMDGSDLNIDYEFRKNGATQNTRSGTGDTLNFENQFAGYYTVFATNTITGCTNNMSGNATLVEHPLPVVTLSDDKICEDETFSFDAGSDYIEYIWSDGYTTQTFDSTFNDISVTAAHAFSVTVTDVNHCTDVDTMYLTVDTLPDVSISGISNTYNYTANAVEVKVFPHDSLLVGDGTLTGTGVTTADNYFHPDLADTLPDRNTITYTFTDLQGCTNFDSFIIDVATNDGRIDSIESLYCFTDPIDTIYGFHPDTASYPGGDFFIDNGSGKVPLVSIGKNLSYIDPSIYAAGDYTVTYEYTTTTDFIVTWVLTIDSVSNVDFGILDTKYCRDDAQVLLAANGLNPPGGTGVFSGGPTLGFDDNANNTAYLRPDQVPEGELDLLFNISYTYISPAGCHSDTVTKPVTIYDLPGVTFDTDPIFNTLGDPVTFVGAPTGGTFNGIGMDGDVFTPSPTIAQDDIVITYTYMHPSTGCVNFDRDTLDVQEAKTEFSNLNSTYCYSDQTISIGVSIDPSETLDGFGTFASKNNGISDNGNNTAEYSIVNAGAGIDTVTFTYYLSGTKFWIDYKVAIDSIASVSFDIDTSYCTNDGIENIFATIDHPNGTGSGHFSGITGTGFIDNGNSAVLLFESINPANYSVEYLYTSSWENTGCQKSLIKPVKVFGIPDVEFDMKDNYSELETADPGIQLVGTPTGGSFSGILSGAAELTTDGSFTAGVGNYIITYTYTEATTACTNFANDTTDVLAITTSITGQQADYIYCFTEASTDTLVGAASDGQPGGTFSGDPGTSYITYLGQDSALFNPVAAGEGIHNVYYTYQKFDGDEVTIDRQLEVEKIGTVDFDILDEGVNYYCENFDPQNDNIIEISAIYDEDKGTGQFTGPAAGWLTGTGFAQITTDEVTPQEADLDITFTYTSNYSGCTESITKQLHIYPKPAVSFEIKDIYNIAGESDSLIGTPPGGTFSGDIGGLRPSGKFYPDDAEVGNFTITYTYTDEKGCKNDTDNLTSIQAAAGEISSSQTTYCYDDPIQELVWIPDPNRISGGQFIEIDGLVNRSQDTAVINPSELGDGEHEITFVYYKTGSITFDTAQFEIKYLIEIDSVLTPSFTDISGDEYCISGPNSEVISLFGGTSADYRFTGDGVIDGSNGSAEFNPAVAGLGTKTIRLTYTDPNSGCQNYVEQSTKVNNLPSASFEIDNGCKEDSIQFTYNPITDYDSIESWHWEFGDILSSESFRENPKFKYSTSGIYNVRLNLTSKIGCVGTVEQDITLDDLPEPNFTWLNECFGTGNTTFTNTSHSNSDTTTWIWNFGDGNESTENSPVNLYSAPGSYDVSLTAMTKFGCDSTMNHTVNIRETYKFDEIDEYLADFNDGQQSWYVDAINSESYSWEYGIPAGAATISSDNPIWGTNLEGNYNINENSWITSPCFDFGGIDRPMIKFDLNTKLELNSDGLILEYTEDGGQNWFDIGILGDGINWFTSASIRARPGYQDPDEIEYLGWSNESNGWVIAKHDLDLLKDKEKVQFRFAFASNAALEMEGVGLDNIWIGERSRKILFEHFTNNSNTQSATVNPGINQIINDHILDIIDIQYHTNFPGTDPFNELNPFVPSARALYYGVYSVPSSIMDGTEFYDYQSKSFALNDLKVKVLEDPEFDIDLSTTLSSNTLQVNAIIESLMDTSEIDLNLNVAIIERIVTGINAENGEIEFESVLRDMLPNAAGTNFRQAWEVGQIEDVNLSWEISNINNLDEMVVVAFVQNNTSREIYQAATTDTTSATTSIKEFLANKDKFDFLIYPNPTSEKTQILFNNSITSELIVEIYDFSGKLVESEELEVNRNYLSINTENYKSGIFFIKVSDNKSFVKTKKLIIQ